MRHPVQTFLQSTVVAD